MKASTMFLLAAGALAGGALPLSGARPNPPRDGWQAPFSVLTFDGVDDGYRRLEDARLAARRAAAAGEHATVYDARERVVARYGHKAPKRRS